MQSVEVRWSTHFSCFLNISSRPPDPDPALSLISNKNPDLDAVYSQKGI
jgi:hypothetical protein